MAVAAAAQSDLSLLERRPSKLVYSVKAVSCRIRAKLAGLSRCSRVECRAIITVSSVDLLGLLANCIESRSPSVILFRWTMARCSRTPMTTRVCSPSSCGRGLLGDWNGCCSLEACLNMTRHQQGVKDVCDYRG